MDKYALTFVALTGLFATACDESVITPPSRIVFDPVQGQVSLPSDLLLLTSTDGTLDVPRTNPSDPADPAISLSALDGWGTAVPIRIEVKLPTAPQSGLLRLDANSVADPRAVQLHEVKLGHPFSTDPDCVSVRQGQWCKAVASLHYGEDFMTRVDGKYIVIVPLKPLKPKTSYVVALTSQIKDSLGRSVKPSTSYELLQLNAQTQPLGQGTLLQLQQAVNSYEQGLATSGLNRTSIIYSTPFTTQSVVDVMAATRLLIAKQAPMLSPYQMTSLSSADVLSSVQGERLDPLLAAVSSAALVIKSSIDLPMMLDIGSLENCNPLDLIQAGTCDVLSSHWQANGTSPVSIAMAIDAGTLSQTHFAAQALAQNPDLTPADLMNPKQWLGLDIKADNGQVLDADQHLTQYNPVPKLKGLQTAQVLITVPNPDVVNAIRAQQLNLPIELLPSYAKLTKPAQGWPVAMYGHGITFSKETVHGMAGAMALQGLATISIDLPMHGERGVDLNGDGVFEVSATDPSFGPSYVNGSMFAFVNLSSMLSIRDNLRQGSADMLSLRAAISNTGLTEIAQGQPPLLDATQVSYFGHSLGAIVGLPAVAVANTPFTLPDGTELANPFVFNSIAMVTPTAGYVPTAMFSPDFGVKVKVGLTSSDAFQLELSKVSGLTAEQLAGLQQTQPDHYAALVDSLYAEFRQQLTFAAQQVVDGGDPINFAALLTQTGTPALVHEIVGNGADNLSDMVLANSVAAEGWPVAGTEPLIAALNLQGIENTSQDANGIHGAVRLMYGHHLSIVSPAAVEGIAPDPIRNAQTSALIHQQLAEFLASAGTSLTINSLDAVIIAPAR